MEESDRKPEADNNSAETPELTPSVTELSSLIGKLTTRFENWRIENERNPNPRMVHSLKNIIGLLDTVISLSRSRTAFSYKKLTQEMSRFLTSVANLNAVITESLMEDDVLDEDEEAMVNSALMDMVKNAVDLIKIVQQSFGSGGKKLPRISTPLPTQPE